MKEKSFIYNAASIVDPLEVQRIDRQLAGRRAKLMKELRERIAEVERGSPSSTAGALRFGPRSRRRSTRGCWLGWARETSVASGYPDDLGAVSLSPNSCRKIAAGPVDVGDTKTPIVVSTV